VNRASLNGKYFGFGLPAASDITDGGDRANSAATNSENIKIAWFMQ